MMRSDRSRAHALVGSGVLLLHVALLWPMLDSSTKRAVRQRDAAPPNRMALRLIAAAPPAAARAVVGPPARARPPNAIRPIDRPSGASAAPPLPETATTAVPQRELAVRVEPAASTEAPAPSLLDTEATRRAIRASARAPSLGDQLSRARDEPEPVGAQARLANGVKAAGKGDCLKGDYAGAGMGLLSLPFLVIAEARGDCAK